MLPYIVPALLTFITGLALWSIKKQRLILVYRISESGTFPIASTQAKYFIIELKNRGNQPIENCNLSIDFDQGKILNYVFSDDKLNIDVSNTESSILCKIPLLNSHEVLKTTITIEGDPHISNPKVNARAVGVTAKLETEEDYTNIIMYAIPVVALSITLGFAGSSIVSWIFPSTNTEVISELTKQTKIRIDSILARLDSLQLSTSIQPDREDIIFAILNKCRLSHIFARLIASREEISYRNTGYYLLYCCLKDEKNKEKYLDAMNQIISVKEIAAGSKSLIYYLLSKLEQNYAHNNLSIKYLRECEKAAPEIYNHLMEQDAQFDINSLKKWALQNWYPLSP